MMNKILLSLLFVVSLFTTNSFAQCPTPDPKMKTREYWLSEDPEREFKLICSYHESENQTFVMADFRITGDGPYDSVDVANGIDPIKGRIGFGNKGNGPIEPMVVFFQFYTSSSNPSRYADGVKLTIFVDGAVLMSSSSTLKDTWKSDSYTTKWFFPADIPYPGFLKIIQAKNVTFQIGETKAELRPREFQRLRDLNNVIPKRKSESSQ